MSKYMRYSVALVALVGLVLPFSVSAATASKLEISGWIPYWRSATGTADVLPHLSSLTEVNPFVLTVKNDLTLKDNGNMGQDPWASFITVAQKQKVRVIPSIMWSDPTAIHAMLSNAKKRQGFEQTIVDYVKQNNFDGIDIDFEGKLADDKDNFSTFLKGLYQRMGNKWVMCTIEARTPPDSYFSEMPDKLEYANDFKAINKYCDRVRFMTYDQESADLKLNASSTGPYSPVADPKWVEKSIRLAMKDISSKKIVIGVATYGYEYNVTAYAGSYSYDLLWAFNPLYGWLVAQQYGLQPVRNAAGELSFSYVPNPNIAPPANGATTTVPTTPISSANMDQVAAAATSLVTTNNTHTTFRLMWWSDSQAIADKIALAKKLGVRGVAVFKMDGGEDQGMWNVLANANKK